MKTIVCLVLAAGWVSAVRNISHNFEQYPSHINQSSSDPLKIPLTVFKTDLNNKTRLITNLTFGSYNN